MLTRLRIENIALVEQLDLTFEPGLSVITGETGAGKSVVVNALALALGERADREAVRHGADRAVVVGEFDVTPLGKKYATQYADYLLDSRLVVRRDIASDGKSKAKIGGDAATITRVKELTTPIGEILGQHANQMLMSEDNHLLFLDYFASLDSTREEVTARFESWQKTAGELKRVTTRREQLAAERELLLFQKEEIDKAGVRAGEEDELSAEKTILDSSRTLMEAAARVQELLDGETASALEMLRQARTEFERMAEIDASLEKKAEEFSDIDYRMEDMRRFVERYGSSVPDDPARLEEINARLSELYKLKTKYGGSEQSILDTLTDITRRLEDRPDTDSLIKSLTKQEAAEHAGYAEEAIRLSEARNKAAAYLSKLVKKELAELAIDNGGFEFEFIYEDDADGIDFEGRSVKPLPHGLETGRFLFSANPGEPLKSLVKTASGGEISRVLLAIKAAEKKNQKQLHPLLVFDEVDAGIGGQTAGAVAEKLKRLADKRQVIVITHLHQIARMADHHYAVTKTSDDTGRAVIQVERLDPGGIERELERMVALPD